MGVDRRSTKDLDATVRGFPLTHENAERAFREIAAVEADDDFSFEFVRTEDIRETDDYPGIRVHLLASYEKMRSPVTVDVTTGDKITPDAVEYSYPLMFDNRSLSLMAYPLPTTLESDLEGPAAEDSDFGPVVEDNYQPAQPEDAEKPGRRRPAGDRRGTEKRRPAGECRPAGSPGCCPCRRYSGEQKG